MASLSPMMQQYLDIKSQHKDHVLFFRLGDFYEMFFDDAINISKELELTLTGRDCGLPERAPMCGIPYHSAEGYVKKLIDKGYKVAICEQVEDPATVQKGIVKREVIRLVTPGTVIENSLLNEESNNYIASVIIKEKTFSICFADISTGDVFLTEQNCLQNNKNIENEVINELSKFMPTEILFNDVVVSSKQVCSFIKNKLNCVCEVYDEEKLEYNLCEKTVVQHFNVNDVYSINLSENSLSVLAVGALIDYINSTQKDGAKRIVSINFYNENQFMSIDLTAKRNLEITQTMRSGQKKGTLLWVLDKTKTAMGKRYMRKALEQPLINIAEITKRQNGISELLKDVILREDLRNVLSEVYDLERLMTRVIYGTINPRELKALGYTISKLPQIKKMTNGFECSYLNDINREIDTLDEVFALIDNSIVDEPPINLKDGGVIKEGFNKELDEYRNLCTNAKDILAEIEENERKETGIKNLKIGYNRVFGYYIEVTKSNLDIVPDRYIRKQTLANCERYITEELKEIEHKVLSANDKIIVLENEIFNEIRKFVATKIDLIQKTASAITRLDFIIALAVVAYENNYVCPNITLGNEIKIKNGRHPVVEKMLDDELFVPNDTLLDCKKNKMSIITGPNMAGKSTYMRQVAVIVIMAQIGSFVPASDATIGICDKVFTRVGASDDLSAGQSTFMVEMSEVAHILKDATPKSLIILDEIGRGTSTFDGMSIAKAVVLFIAKKISAKTLFATHYHELTELENELEGVINYNIAVKKRGDDITFLRKIVRGGADQSYGIEVAKLAGVPGEVISNAKDILKHLEKNSAEVVRKIDCGDNNVDEAVPNNLKIDEAPMQTSFVQNKNSAIIEKLETLQIDALTPIEALNILYEIKKMI